MNPKSTMGTVISLRHLQRIEGMMERTAGKVVIGGERMDGQSALDGHDFSLGSFFPPTVVTDVSVEDELWQEEVFGPVVVVKRFSVCLAMRSFRLGRPANSLARTKPKVSLWQMHLNTVSGQAFGLRRYPGLIE